MQLHTHLLDLSSWSASHQKMHTHLLDLSSGDHLDRGKCTHTSWNCCPGVIFTTISLHSPLRLVFRGSSWKQWMHTHLLDLSPGVILPIVNAHTLLRLFVQGAILTIVNAHTPLRLVARGHLDHGKCTHTSSTCCQGSSWPWKVHTHLFDLLLGVILTMESAHTPLRLVARGHLDHGKCTHTSSTCRPGVILTIESAHSPLGLAVWGHLNNGKWTLTS